VIHLRVVSPPDITATLMPVLRTDPAVMNLTVHLGAVSNPDGDAVQFDVLHGAVNQVIGGQGSSPRPMPWGSARFLT